MEKKRNELYEKLISNLKLENYITRFFLGISFLIIIIGEYFIFNKYIEEPKLIINILSLGAILTTFGSAILSIFLVIERDMYHRIIRNIDIFYRDIRKVKPWRRWQFLKRSKLERNFDNNSVNYQLLNPSIEFDVGSHKIKIFIPTVKEDFYDLPALRSYWSMFHNRKHFKTNAYNKMDSYDDNNFNDVGDSIMGWDCLYDVWKSIMIYRFSRYMLKIGELIVFTSIFYTFIKII